MIGNILLGLAFVFAAIDWVAVARKNKAVEKFVKPLTLVLLVFFVVTSGLQYKFIGLISSVWLIVGLILCLVGDVFLFLPPEQWFAKGLVAFLLGHIGYIISFGVFFIEANRLVPAVFLGVFIFVVDIFVVGKIIRGLKDSGKGRLTIPIVIYSAVISFMLFSAGYKLLDLSWTTGEAAVLSSGALLFYISDILNAWERFVSKFKNDRLIIMMTYHLGQFGVAIGMVLHLKNFVS